MGTFETDESFGWSFQEKKEWTITLHFDFHVGFSDIPKAMDARVKLSVFEVIQKSFCTGSDLE